MPVPGIERAVKGYGKAATAVLLRPRNSLARTSRCITVTLGVFGNEWRPA